MMNLKRCFFSCFLILASILTVACTRDGKTRDMDAKEANGMVMNRLGILVDVREANELQESGIAEGALWMPTSKISENHPDWQAFKKNLKKDQQIILYCRSGARSGRVAGMLSAEGYNTANMGGFSSWVEAKLPVKKFNP
jgi:rhodanese-related sulfurtransferase